jgi:hypothetical protein
MLLHVGFEKPTPEIMEAWGNWFESVADRTVEHGGVMNGRELSHDGTRDLPFDREAMTGYSIINADSIEQAQEIASGNPFITGIRIYEIREHG